MHNLPLGVHLIVAVVSANGVEMGSVTPLGKLEHWARPNVDG